VSFADPQMQTEVLGRKQILYAIVDPAQISSRHPQLFQKVFDLTFVLTQRLLTKATGQVKFFDTVDDAMAHGRFSDLVIVQSVGNFILEYRFLEELDRFCKFHSDFFLLAFPPTPRADHSGWQEFDSRMMVVNVASWRQLGYPGLNEIEALPRILDRATADKTVHDCFQPCDSHKSAPIARSVPGQGFLDAVKSRGLTIHTFPESLVDCSLYVRPEIDSGRLYEGLVNRDESLVLDFDQKKWIRLSVPRPTIWIYNSEPYRFNIPIRHVDAYFGPAAGFKYLDMLSYNPNVEFFFYDQSEESLEWIEELKRNWDGNDFAAYLDRQPETLKKKFKYVNSSIEQNQRLLFDDLGGEDSFKRLWNLFRSASAKFFKCNLFDTSDVRELLSKTNATRPFFYYSNIFSTIFTLAAFSREEAEARYSRFQSLVRSKFPGAVMHGADVSGRWH
jgi:hypothetical protein